MAAYRGEEVIKLAWMSDEQYELMQDTKEKKHTARSAFNTRSHCGKSGCNFSYEKMTKKELAAMNGEVKSFRMNDPMSWEEFKALPDDLKVIYVKNLRNAYGVTDTALAEAWGVSRSLIGKWFKTLKLLTGPKGKANRNWDRDGFLAWWNGVKVESKVEEVRDIPVEEHAVEVSVEPVEAVETENVENNQVDEESAKAALAAIYAGQYEYDDGTTHSTHSTYGETKTIVPVQGSMIFEGNIDDILRTVRTLLDSKNVHIKVEWDLLGD